VDALAPVLLAQSAFLSGLIANEIWHEGAVLPDFKFMIAAVVGFLMLLALLPLALFAFQMASARREALREYGLLASRYADEFRHKWIRAAEPGGEMLLGTADIQSLADLANGLSLTMVPFEEMVRTLINVLL
jgi:hypothetical protein